MTSLMPGGADDGRIGWIDTAKGVSILLVTLLHVGLLGVAAGLPVRETEALNAFLAPIRMPLFFAAAGVFAGPMIGKPWPELLRRRVALYIWLLLIWTIVRWCVSAFIVRNPASPEEGRQLSEIAWAIVMPTTGLWFLWSLALFFVLAKLLTAAPRTAGIAVAVLASAGAMIALAGLEDRALPWFMDNIAYRNSVLYFVFFFTAAVAPGLIRSLGEARLVRSIAICAGVFAVATLAIRSIDMAAIAGIARFIASVAGVAALLMMARLIDRLGPIGPVMRHIGRNTLPIYVAQVPLIALFTALLGWAGAARLGMAANLMIWAEAAVVVGAALALHAALLKAGAYWFYALPRMRPGPVRGRSGRE